MPRKAAGLTARKVETITTPGLFADGNGLYLQVTASGSKSWIFRYLIAGRRRDMGLGPVSVISLTLARERAVQARRLVLDGFDPLELKRQRKADLALAAAKAKSFRDCAEAFIETNRTAWTNAKHEGQWRATLESYAYPLIGDLPVAAIDTGLVLNVLEPLWSRKTETASRLRGRLEAVLDYAKVRGYREGDNPARWKGHLALILPRKSAIAPVNHHASLGYDQLPGFWDRLAMESGPAAEALRLLILTAARSGEVLGAGWPEIDLTAGIWTIPADRMKAGGEHRVPLSPAAVAVLEARQAARRDDQLFPGNRRNRPLSAMTVSRLLHQLAPGVTVHGFRATFRTWVAERTAYPHDVAEAALAHTQGDKVVAAYQRGDFFDKRRRLMAEWALFVTTTSPVASQGEGVVPLRRIGG